MSPDLVLRARRLAARRSRERLLDRRDAAAARPGAPARLPAPALVPEPLSDLRRDTAPRSPRGAGPRG